MAELANHQPCATDGDGNSANGAANSNTGLERDLEADTRSALLCYSRTGQHSGIQQLLQKFAQPLKSNFENSNLWLRYGLVLALGRSAPQSAVQAFKECARINPQDPLPAMLAAKLLLEDLDDPEAGLCMANEAIERCLRLVSSGPALSEPAAAPPQEADTNKQPTSCNGTSIQNGTHNDDVTLSSTSSAPATTTKTRTITNSKQTTKCCHHYSNIPHLLSKCYLLASIMNAYIYEREPESIKQFKLDNLTASIASLELAAKTCVNNHLVYFHMALHDVRQKSFTSAIENTRQAIKLNPQHLPSMQLLILALSALKLYDKALLLCESALQEFEDNLLLLYIKCNLEQNLVKTRGYKSALTTAQYMLKCIIKSSSASSASSPPSSSNASSTATTCDSASPGGGPATSTAPNTTTKQSSSNLFSETGSSCIYRRGKQTESFQSELQVWLLVAEIFIRIGSITDAELCVDEGSNHLDGALSYQVMFVWGLIAKAKNNLIEAKSFFQSCLALCPRHAKALQEIAHVYYLLGNHSTAEKFLRDSLDEDSECDKAWYYLSLVFIETNQHEKAKEASDRAQQLENSAPVVPFSTISRLTLE